MIENRYIKKFSRQLEKISKEFNRQGIQVSKGVNRILFNGANDVTNTIKMSMRNTKRANYSYKRGRKQHRPSAKGFPPAIDSGQLVRNILFDFRPWQVEIGVNKNAPYGKWLEKGTKKMEERPFLEPGINMHKDKIFDDLLMVVPDIAGIIFRGAI